MSTTGSIKDLHEHDGQNIWIDLVDPTLGQIQALRKFFPINESAMQQYDNKSKKVQIRLFDDQKFTVLLAIGFENSRVLTAEPIYLFVGKGWLITIHSVAAIGAIEELRGLLEQKDKHLMASSIDGLYYPIIIGIVNSYEQMLTSMELTIASLGNNSLRKSSMKMLESLDTLSKQIIILRRHFWHTRHVVNLLLNSGVEDDEDGNNSSKGSGSDVKSLKVAYDEINQLIDLIESLRDSINSTRDLYVANISLQLNDTMKTLTIFSSILLPLTFVASLYGMNGLDLNNIGEIPVGFSLVIASMAVVAGVLFAFFRRKQWILVAKEPAENSKTVSNKDKDKDGGKKTKSEL